MRVYAPNTTFNGITAGVSFADGVGETDNQAALAWLERAGYGIGAPHPAYGQRSEPYQQAIPTVVRGTESRDASIEKDAGGPVSDAFLPPTNAGEADPNGPLVVSPGLHAVEPPYVRPGPVAVDNPAQQEVDETAHAEREFSVGGEQPVDVELPSEQTGAAPAKSASKAAWVDYAVAQGADRDEVEDLTKPAIQERYA